MKNKLIIASAIIAVAALSSVATVAAVRYLPWTVNIYSVSDTENADTGRKATTVSTFDDRGNKCYIVSAVGEMRNAISCVRMK